MPKSKFDAFYYGIGMKLDEASVDEAGKKLEGKLNKVVDNVTKNLTTVSETIAKGVKDVDTKKLVQSLVDAQKELNRFQNFDPSKLQKQIDVLNTTVTSLGTSLGNVGAQLKEFTDDVTSRLSNIEIRTSKQGRDALKSDLKEMKTLAQGYSRVFASGEKIDTSALDRYFQKIKDGFASLKASGNPMEIFADKELANYFIDLTNILRKMGAPVEDLRADFFELSSAFKGVFEKTNISGAQSVFKNIGYQIEAVNAKLRNAQAKLSQYESQIKQMQSRVNSTGFAITTEDDKNLSFDEKIDKIQKYEDSLSNFKVGSSEWFETMKKQIALIQDAEKELLKLSKGTNGTQYLQKWKNAFYFDLDDKFSQDKMYSYVEYAKENLQKLIELRETTRTEIQKYQSDIGKLTATEAATSSKKDKRAQKSTTQKQKATGVVAEVEAKIKINETQWTQTINAALKNIESKNKVKPFKIKVEATQGKILDEIKKIKEATLMDKKNNGEKDVVQFNKNFDKFINNLKARKQELIDELKKNWHPALKQAFSFKIELLDDIKSDAENIATHMLPAVDAINMILENKPLIFHSNIDALIEEIKTKLQGIKIDIGAGNVNINPQGLSNANIIIGGIIGGGSGAPPVNPPQPPTPTSQPIAITSSGDIDKQVIYNNAVTTFEKWMDGFTDPIKALGLVKKQAQALYQRLQDAEEGTQEYYEAQIQLTTLLSKWRGKIGAKNASEEFKVSKILGKGTTANWNKYLIDNGIIPDPKNSRLVSSASKLEELYGLKKPSKKSISAGTSQTSRKQSIQTAEEQMAEQLAAGRKIVENYIKLAKWAKALNTIAEGADIEIKESDFKDRDTITRRGNIYTKDDIGTVIKGRKIEFEDLDAFIAEYEQSESEEDRQLFGFLKNLIDAYKSNQQKLDSLLDELSDSDVVGRYEFADNKKEMLATDLKSAYKTIMSKRGSKKAQQHLTDVFGKYNIDLSSLSSAKTYAEQWQIIEQQIIGRKGLNFDSLMSELSSLEGNVGKTYENFMTLLKVSRAYMLASNSLGEVGQEASILMRGKKERVDKEIREYDPSTGRTRGTGKYIEAGRNAVVTEGLRQEISKLAVVFIDQLGNAIYGFGAGKGVVDDKKYLSGSSASFSKIVTFLTTALNQAAQIAFDTSKKGMKGYEGVTNWTTPDNTKASEQPYEFTTVTTEKSKIEGYIRGTERVIESKKKLKDKLLEENKQIQETITKLEGKNNRTEKENQQLETLKITLQNNNNKISECTDEIKKQQERLPELQASLKNADNKKVKYSKSYDRAVSDFPSAQSRKQNAIVDLNELGLSYGTEQASFLADIIMKQKSGEITQGKVNEILQLVPKITELNQKLIEGKISYQDYIKTVENAYITMRNATTDEAKASAKADAERLAKATELVRKYQEEEKILQEIIRTQKPKEQTAPKTTGSNNKPKDKPQSTSQPTHPIGGNGQTVVDGALPIGVNGNIVANITGTGLATEGTVKAIYNLLSVKKNGGVDSKIEEVKKVISVKEEEARVKAEETRKAQEAEAARKKAEEEAARKAAEAEATRKKAEEDAAKAEAEKKAQEKARKAAEEQARKEAEKKASEERARKESEAREEAQKRAIKSKPENKNTEQSFFGSAKKTYQETSSGNKVFREQRILSDGGKIIKEFTGLFGSIVAAAPKKFESHGHTHPRDSLYSGTDIKTMAQIRGFNSSYNTDWLITPSNIYKLTGLANASIAKIEQLAKAFEDIEQSGMNEELARKVKESELYHFAQDNGLNYSKNTYDKSGNLTNITDKETFISKEALANIKEFINVLNELKTATGDKKQVLLGKKQVLHDKLKQDAIVGPLMLSDDQDKFNERNYRRAESRKMRSSTLIQEAIDYDFDFSLFINQFKDFFESLDILGEKIKPNSSLAQINGYIQELSGLDKSSEKYQDIIKKIKPLAQTAFGRSNSPHMDIRYLGELQDIASRDKSGIINRTISQVRADGLLQSNTYDEYKDKSIEDLRAELARLEALRDSSEVDPRFATAEKQDIIIELLRNGVKVVGGGSGGGTSDKRGGVKTLNIPSTARADEKIQAIDKLGNVNKNSLLYKQYDSAKSNLESAIKDAQSKGKDLTLQDANRIKALVNEVAKLGNRIINAANSFEQFKSRGGEAIDYTSDGIRNLKDEMLELAYKNASESKMLLSDVSYDEVTQKMTYSLTDLEGNVTKVTMAYQDLFGVISKTSNKTTNSASKIYKTIEGEMLNRIGVSNLVNDTPNLEKSTEYQSYLSVYDSMMSAQDRLREKGELATKEEKDELVSITKQVEEARIKFEQLANASDKFKSKIKSKDDIKSLDDISPTFDVENQDAIEKAMKDFALSQDGLTEKQKRMILETWNFKNAQDGATYSVLRGKDQIASMSIEMDKGSMAIGRYTVETKKYMSGFDKFMASLKGKWQEVARYLMTFGSMYRVFAELQRGAQYVKEIDSALTELKKVTDETEETYNRFLNTAAKTADKVGSTIKEVVSSTADWARLGYSLEDAANLAESTSVLLNVSEFQSIDEATSALVSTMQAFGYAAEDSMHVVDVMNEIKLYLSPYTAMYMKKMAISEKV